MTIHTRESWCVLAIMCAQIQELQAAVDYMCYRGRSAPERSPPKPAAFVELDLWVEHPPRWPPLGSKCRHR